MPPASLFSFMGSFFAESRQWVDQILEQTPRAGRGPPSHTGIRDIAPCQPDRKRLLRMSIGARIRAPTSRFDNLVAFTPASAAQLTLTWTDTSTNEDGFKVERKTESTGAYGQWWESGEQDNLMPCASTFRAGWTTTRRRVTGGATVGRGRYSGSQAALRPGTP
jgi:hypothetical protein